MRRKLNRSPEEMARREKISEMLQALDISSMDDIKELYRQTIAQFMENSLGANWTKVWDMNVTTKLRKIPKTAGMAIARKR